MKKNVDAKRVMSAFTQGFKGFKKIAAGKRASDSDTFASL
jgi:hypothetical protein